MIASMVNTEYASNGNMGKDAQSNGTEIPQSQLLRGLVSKLQELKQGNKSVVEVVQAMCDLDESEDVPTCSHYYVLRLDIRHLLAFQNFEMM